MKAYRTLSVLVIVLVSLTSFGQKIKVTSGNLSDLKGETEVRIEYDYSNLGVGKYDVEEEYINDKVAKMNKDEEGAGDKWKEAWFNDRPTRYEVKFEELFSEHAAFLKSGKDVESDLAMNIHTTFIEPGYNVGVSRKPALINLEVSFLKGGEELVHLQILKSPGSGAMGYDFDAGYRIQEAYAKAAKSLGKYMTKALK